MPRNCVIFAKSATMKLYESFYLDTDVVNVAKKLIGCELHTYINGMHRSGIIVETEAYSYREKACHAFEKKRTKRTETMFVAGGVAYVYLCYGIHHLFNVVTNIENEPEAVLIRALQPTIQDKAKIASGPGKLTKYMNIHTRHNGISLMGNEIWIESGETMAIESSKRIGIDYAGNDANLPWRFTAKNNHWISR